MEVAEFSVRTIPVDITGIEAIRVLSPIDELGICLTGWRGKSVP